MNYNKEVQVKLKREDIKAFEQKVLISGLCDFSLPVIISNKNNETEMIYDCSGFVSVRDLRPHTTNEVFEILEKTILSLNKSKEFFIRSEKLTLSLDTVFYNLKKKDVRIAYIPCEEENVNEKVLNYIESLKEYANDETKDYLELMQENIYYLNHNLKDTLSYVREQRRNFKSCGL